MVEMPSSLSTGESMKNYKDKVLQTCKDCSANVLAIRINGFYAGSRDRIFLWECPICESIWRKPRPVVKDDDL